MGLFFIYAWALLAKRLFLSVFPLREGEIAPGTQEEFGYQVYLLFNLVLFYPLTRSRFIPVPLLRLLYLGLGAKLGSNSYCAGTIQDPLLTIVGSNSLIGEDALLYSHAIEGDKLSHAVIQLGDNVTVGARAIIMSGVSMGNGSMLAANSVAIKNTAIGAGEIWAGAPAKRVGQVEEHA
ncbi:MAG: DapH/DapD/GlmU-related protein [Pseudomonadota bacterium]